ncbi:HEPN domain-containing protein [Paenibacillus aurantius]|uniref:HEPN domain-containing protein n=1 Tax=Paenibacillus aurantius TaxID=2918900 RepID=A0AA96LAM3_9BACL|nr:HEPN domain-containing protein [Paenibacillus aurantius]WNQ09619.1 HEPN domain-containing protein [Paenibacillus aurantius]
MKQYSLDILLPFKLPIEDDIKFVSGYFFGEFITTFHTYGKEIKYSGDDTPVIEESTCMSIVFVPKDDFFKDEVTKEDSYRVLVLKCIEYINKFIDALRTCFGLDYLYNITIADLPQYLIIDLNGESCLYLTKPQEVLRKEILLSTEGMKRLGNTLHTWELYPEQFLVDKFFDSAKSHLYREQHLDAIIDLQTSFEIFIRNTHRLILTKQGVSTEEIEKVSSYAFRNVIEQHLAKQLGVDLRFNTLGPIKNWYEILYNLRNQIVHQGRTYVTGNEAYDAYDVYVAARNYISDALVAKGYLDHNGKVDLNLFQKNVNGSIDINEIVKSLKERGLIDNDLKLE